MKWKGGKEASQSRDPERARGQPASEVILPEEETLVKALWYELASITDSQGTRLTIIDSASRVPLVILENKVQARELQRCCLLAIQYFLSHESQRDPRGKR